MCSLRSVWVVGAASLTACAPVSTSVRKSEQVSARHDERGAVVRTKREAAITTTGELAVSFTERDVCRVQTVEEFRRSERTTKSVSKGVVALEYIAGITLGAVGGFALSAPDQAADAVEPIKPLDKTQVMITGGTAGVIGAFALIVGIVDSTRGGESTKTFPLEKRNVGSPTETACGERPVSGAVIDVVAGTRTAPLPATDDKGTTRTSWDVLSVALFEGAEPPDRAELRAGAEVIGTIELAALRTEAIERAWTVANTAGTARAAAEFKAKFPGAHRAEVEGVLSAKGDAELDAAVSAALAANDLVAAHKLVEEWGAWLPASTQRPVRVTEIAAEELEAKIVEHVAGIEAALTAVGEPTDLTPLVRAAVLAEELVKVAPNDPRTTTAAQRIAEVRTTRQKLLVTRARAEEKAGKLDEAVKVVTIAVEIAPQDKGTLAQKADLEKRVARRHAASAVASTRKKDFELAAVALSRAEALRKDDREVVLARKIFDQTQAAAEAAIADAAERARKKAEREAKEAALRLEREAEAKRAEEERLARIAERTRKEEEVKAAREAERLAKLEEKQRKDAELAAAREAARLAKLDEKQRKDAEAKARLEEKLRNDAELAAAREAERLAKLDEKQRKDAAAKAKLEELAAAREAERLAKLDEKQRAAELAAAREAERFAKLDDKQRAAQLAKLDEMQRKSVEAKLRELDRIAKMKQHLTAGTSSTVERRIVPGRQAGTVAVVASPAPEVRLPGTWVATGATNIGVVTFVLNVNADGTGSVQMLGPTRRMLGMQAVTWSANKHELELRTNPRVSLNGAARFDGEAVRWAGYRWNRVARR